MLPAFIVALAADAGGHLADVLHGLGQILHDLHISNTSKIRCGLFVKLQSADAGSHFADVLHSLDNILLHNKIPPELSVKSFVFLAGSVAPLNQA